MGTAAGVPATTTAMPAATATAVLSERAGREHDGTQEAAEQD
jgi:hypothetical protein